MSAKFSSLRLNCWEALREMVGGWSRWNERVIRMFRCHIITALNLTEEHSENVLVKLFRPPWGWWVYCQRVSHYTWFHLTHSSAQSFYSLIKKEQIKKLCKNKKKTKIKLSKMGFSFTPTRHWTTQKRNSFY